MLAAHAAALMPIEAWIDLPDLVPGTVARSPALADDLAALGRPVGPVAPVDWPRSAAARWGAAYVVEGSRLGNQVILRDVPADLPRRYLGAVGTWRAFVSALDREADHGGPAWQDEAIAAAQRTFAVYRDAARFAVCRDDALVQGAPI